jgi:hypothetical protein
VAAGLDPLFAHELALEVKTKAELQDRIYWLSQQQRQQAFKEIRKRTVLAQLEEMAADGADTFDAINAIIDKADPSLVTKNNVESATQYYQGVYISKLSNLVERYRSRPSLKLKDLFISNDAEAEALLVRAIHGEKVGDPDIEGFAREWLALQEEMRTNFNTVGGWIDKNENWLLPQSWDAVSVKKKFPEAKDWVEYMRDRVDKTKMKARDIVPAEWTGTKGNRTVKKKAGSQTTDRTMEAEELDEALEYMYETITNNGHNKIDPGADNFPGRSGIATKYNHERLIHIDGAENWLEIHKSVGRGGSIFDMMMGHVDRMAADTAVLEVMPPAAFETAMAWGRKRGLPTYGEERLENRYKLVSGRLDTGSIGAIAQVMEGVRNVVTFGKLGSAVLMATADTAFATKTAQLNGMSPATLMARHIKTMMGDSDDMVQKAREIGMTADAASMSASSNARMGEHALDGATGKMAQGVLRASGLSAWTHTARVSFQVEFNFLLGRNFGKSWGDLEPNLQTAMKRYDIDEAKWDSFRSAGKREDGLIDLTPMAARDFHRMIMSETDFAVPTPDAKARAWTTGGKGRDTIEGQMWRSMMNLKAFPLTIMTSHWQRMMNDKFMTGMDKAQYGAQLFAHTAILGAMVVYAKEILNGKEPRPLEDETAMLKLLGEGALAGGSLALVGDMFVKDPFSYGSKGMGDQLIKTPTTGILNDLTVLSGRKFLTDESYSGNKYAVDAIKAVGRNTPGVWYLNPLTKSIGYALEEAVAPDEARARRLRAEQREQKNHGRGFR